MKERPIRGKYSCSAFLNRARLTTDLLLHIRIIFAALLEFVEAYRGIGRRARFTNLVRPQYSILQGRATSFIPLHAWLTMKNDCDCARSLCRLRGRHGLRRARRADRGKKLIAKHGHLLSRARPRRAACR